MLKPHRQLGFLLVILAILVQALVTLNCGTPPVTVRQSLSPQLNTGTVTSTANPLVAQYSISTSSQATVTIEFGPDTNYGFRTSAQMTPSGGGQVSTLVAGMKQNSTYHLRAIVDYMYGTEQFDSDHTFQTGSVPQGRLAQVVVTTPSGSTPAPGVELVGLNPGSGNPLLVEALDPGGNVIWYYDFDPTLGVAQPIKPLSNGHFIVVLCTASFAPTNPCVVREIDLAGTTIHQFTSSDLTRWLSDAGFNLTVNAIHHDIVRLANGHLLVLMNSYKSFTDLPGYPGQTNVLGDAIVDLDSNYKPVWVWNTFDHLDVTRHPMLFPDWTHSNTLLYSPDDGNLLLSIRHQYWVVKIDYEDGRGSGNVLWRLGYQGDFALASGSPANWFYAQHYANIVSPSSTGDFQLALFDNGDNRVMDSSGTTCGSTGAPPCYSRPAIFEVNEATKTASLVWAYNTVYSFWGGVVQLLPTSDIFFA